MTSCSWCFGSSGSDSLLARTPGTRSPGEEQDTDRWGVETAGLAVRDIAPVGRANSSGPFPPRKGPFLEVFPLLRPGLALAAFGSDRVTYNARMPKLAVEGYATVDVQADKRLVLAIEQDVGVDVMHACGGNARCTTCRVEFIEGEPSRMTAAEKGRLAARGLAGVRLSCQILCDHDMAVRAISRLEGTGRPDPGPTPEATITPLPEWN